MHAKDSLAFLVRDSETRDNPAMETSDAFGASSPASKAPSYTVLPLTRKGFRRGAMMATGNSKLP